MATRYIQGNNEIQGSNDGVAPAAGYVGEVKTSTKTTISETAPGVSGTWYASGVSLTLEPGVWAINASGIAATYYSAYTNGGTETFIAICTGTTASPTIVTVAACAVPPRIAEVVGVTYGCLATISVSSTTTYYLYYRRVTTGTNTVATTGINARTDVPMRLEAVRIA